jgi:hypothetical protein
VLQRLTYLREIVAHPLNRNDVIRAAIGYLRWNLGRRLIDIEYVLPLVNDARIIVSNEENYATRLFAEGLWDFFEMMFVLHFLRRGDLLSMLARGSEYTPFLRVGSERRLQSHLSRSHQPTEDYVPTLASTESREL